MSQWQKLNCVFGRRRKNPTCDGSSVEMDERQFQRSMRCHPWTHVHSNLVIMGGFAFDTSYATLKFLPYGRSRLILRFRALEYLADYAPYLILDLS